MKLDVLIPSEEYRGYAGARIRYGRLAPELARQGIALELRDIGEFTPERADCDALLISKCHDSRALVAAAAANARGQLVGVDLFDDYFSQTADSRLMRYRLWLRQLLGLCDFALCSTPAMARVVASYRPDLATLVVNDPEEGHGDDKLADALEAKLARTRDELTLRLLWFGVGDNPNFRVGLHDLASYSGMLAQLSAAAMDIELTILTNERALTADGLALVRQVPIRTQIEQWTQAREREALANAFACFLPVNAQPFSAAKSLNRAVTALSAGCQVISAGYPLYAPMGDVIYRDAQTFVADLQRGSMKHSPAGLDKYRARINEIASAANEAARISEFLQQLRPVREEEPKTLVLVHGHATNGAAHKAVRALNGLSVGSPYCAAELGFDVMFRSDRGRLVTLVSERGSKRLKTEHDAGTLKPLAAGKYRVVADEGADVTAAEGPQDHAAALPFQLATYGRTMERISERMEELFGPCRVLISENSPLPFGLNL